MCCTCALFTQQKHLKAAWSNYQSWGGRKMRNDPNPNFIPQHSCKIQIHSCSLITLNEIWLAPTDAVSQLIHQKQTSNCLSCKQSAIVIFADHGIKLCRRLFIMHNSPHFASIINPLGKCVCLCVWTVHLAQQRWLDFWSEPCLICVWGGWHVINAGYKFREKGSSLMTHQPPARVTHHTGKHWHGWVPHLLCCSSAWKAQKRRVSEP